MPSQPVRLYQGDGGRGGGGSERERERLNYIINKSELRIYVNKITSNKTGERERERGRQSDKER